MVGQERTAGLPIIRSPRAGEEGRTGERRAGAARGTWQVTLATALAVAVSLAKPERAAAAPCTLTTIAAADVNAGDLYTLSLGAAGDVPTSWTINWGDGDIETFGGNPASVTHTYNASAPSMFTHNILASAVCSGTTYLQNELVVPSAQNDKLNWYDNTGAPRTPARSGQDFGLDYPLDSLIGPDGNLYVSRLNSGNVVRYNPTTAAVIDDFATAGTAASGIAFGSDGNLYAVEHAISTVTCSPHLRCELATPLGDSEHGYCHPHISHKKNSNYCRGQ